MAFLIEVVMGEVVFKPSQLDGRFEPKLTNFCGAANVLYAVRVDVSVAQDIFN